MIPSSIDRRRITIFLLLAFSIAWSASLAIALTGGLASPSLVAGINLPLLLLAGVVMPAPTLAHLLTRWITHEGWQDLRLRPQLRKGRWRFWALAWLGTPLLILVGGATYYLLFPAQFDPTLAAARQLIEQATGQPLPIPIETLVLLQSLQAILIAPLINGLFTFGEEFGWRAYLQPKLLPLGWRKTMVAMGLLWGLWHAPVIALGHNYGLNYPGFPGSGILMMCWMTFVVGVWLGWLTLKGESVWPAVIGHGALNGFAAITTLCLTGTPNVLLGPTVAGAVGAAGFAFVAALLLRHPPAELVHPPKP
ncbi:MAG: CPBP family intramembrane glutamic endopeptidase [Caldilinea sp.]|jgi:hypothetical protein